MKPSCTDCLCSPKEPKHEDMGEMSGKTASEGGFVILNGSKRAKKCKNCMNLEIPTQMKHGTEPGDECADAERSAMPRVF